MISNQEPGNSDQQLRARKLCSECFLVSDIWLLLTPERSEGSPTQMGKLFGGAPAPKLGADTLISL